MRTNKLFTSVLMTSLALGVLAVGTSQAVTHVINFGGTLGNTYSPTTFSAAVGDTVKWVGSFSAHPLASTTIPTNAPPWGTTSGSSFSYQIGVAGDYHYKCTVHPGMIGSFSVAATGTLHNPSLPATGLATPRMQFFLDGSGQPFTRLILSNNGRVKLQMFDLLGREKATLINGNMPEGVATVWLGGKKVEPGRYFLRLTADNIETSRVVTIP
jgi:plastocyanin